MDFEANGMKVGVDARTQSPEALLAAHAEITDVLREMGAEIPSLAGALAVEATQAATPQTPEIAEVLPPLGKEAFKAEKLPFAIIGGNAIVVNLNSLRKPKNHVEALDPATVEKEYDAWFTEDRFAFVKSTLEADPELEATIDATPNIKVSGKEVLELEHKFGEGQPYKTDVWSNILTEYTDTEVSGTNPDNGNTVMFSIRFSKPTPNMSGNRKQQIVKLGALQAVNPFVRDHSPLEAVTHAQTLRAQSGDKPLVGDAAFYATVGRNFTMEPKSVGGGLCVPDFFVSANGEPVVGDSGVVFGVSVSVVVG